MKRLLLISNSTQHGRGYLDHVEGELRDFLGAARRIAFVPFAMFDRASYTDKTRARIEAMGYELAALEKAEAIFIGGGNTFRLLKGLEDSNLLEPIRKRVESGAPYVGSSAGAIVAGPTLKTTKDMPIVQPRSFDALALVEFQISPHYLDPDPSSKHMGETQEERISQFLEENDAPVVGLREGAWLRVEGKSTRLGGAMGARIFRKNQPPLERRSGEELEIAR